MKFSFDKAVLKDIAERTFWTAAQAGVAYLATRAADISPEYAVPLAAGLAVLKGFIASHIGKKDAALPSVKE